MSSGESRVGRPPPEEPLRILLVEDVETDAELTVHELRRAGIACTVQRVDSEAGLERALRDFDPHLVLSDHSLPQFNAADALRLVHRDRPHTPVIIVTGSLDEETAAEYIKAGAVDYIVKHRLFRLGPAVLRAHAMRRAIDEAAAAGAALRALEEQHRQAQKMEAIGRLASGVAHDFNNMLTVITACCEMVLEDLGPDAPARREVLEIVKVADRTAALTRQLLAFSRQQPAALRQVDLNELIGGMVGMLERLLGAGVALEFLPGTELEPVWADPGQLEQVVMNLAVNARDAMPDGGRLTIETHGVALDPSAAPGLGARPGPHAMLVVRDTGTGMDAETRAHLFEPFFTTKPRGQGTGLGLATVYGIVQRTGGHILVESAPGRGTRFEVYLPQSRAGAPPGV